MQPQFLIRTLALAVGLAASAAANASITLYTSQSSFLSAITSVGVDGFDDLPPASAPAVLDRHAGAFGYHASTSADPGDSALLHTVGTPADTWLSTQASSGRVTFDRFSGDVGAVGGLFFASDAAGSFLPQQVIQLVATDADGSLTRYIVDTTPATFVGFVSNGSLTSLTVSAVQDMVPVWPTINNLTLGSVSAVPEPASAWLLLAGLCTSGWAGMRRRRCAAL